jgi:hypothetical protein
LDNIGKTFSQIIWQVSPDVADVMNTSLINSKHNSNVETMVAPKQIKWAKTTLFPFGIDVSEPSDSQRTRSQNRPPNFALMTKIIEQDDPKTYEEAKGNPL